MGAGDEAGEKKENLGEEERENGERRRDQRLSKLEIAACRFHRGREQNEDRKWRKENKNRKKKKSKVKTKKQKKKNKKEEWVGTVHMSSSH